MMPDSNLTNITSGNNGTYEFYQTEQLVYLSTVFVMIVVGNTMVLVAIVQSGKRRSRMNFFMINLVCADLSVGWLFVLTDIIWKVTIVWYAGNVGCKLVKFAQGLATFGATYALVALSIDRLDVIARPLSMVGVDRRCRLVAGFGWMFAAVFSLPMMFMYKQTIIGGLPQCWMELENVWQWRLYFTLVAIAIFILPALIIGTCYAVIVVIIWRKSILRFDVSSNPSYKSKHHGNPNGTIRSVTGQPDRKHIIQGGSSSRGVIPRAKIKTIKMTFTIVLAFIFCWSPYVIYDLVDVYGHIPKTPETYATATFVQSLAPLNSAANPIIYSLFNAAMCTSLFKRRRHSSFNSATMATQL